MSEGSDNKQRNILHCFADFGTESEILSWYGDVIRVGIDPQDTNDSNPIRADADVDKDGKYYGFPIRDDFKFDLGFFHPVCSMWAETTSISGNPDEHVNMIPSARYLGKNYCDHYVIENVPRAPLNDPIILEGRMFGLPIKFERAFETTFEVSQPPRQKRFVSEDGLSRTAETSTFFFSERTRAWWASVKHVPENSYPKQHLAKNTIPGAYIHHLIRAWLREVEQGNDIDYSNYDQEMDRRRIMEDENQTTLNDIFYD